MANQRKESPRRAELMRQVKAKKQAPLEDNKPPTESQEVATFQQFLRKPKGGQKEIQQFQTDISNDQKEARALLQQKLQQARAEHARRRESISALIEKAFRPPCYDDTTNADFESYPGTSIATNIIYQSVADVFKSSKEMVQAYNDMEKKIADVREKENDSAVAKDWERDIKDIQRKLELGRRTALRQVKKVLGAKVAADCVGENVDEEDMNDVEVGEEEQVDDGLYMALRYVERGVKRMVKALPRDEMDIYEPSGLSLVN